MSVGELVPDPEGEALPSEVRHVYSRMCRDAGGVYTNLHAAWQRPVRHNKPIERAALWYGLELANDGAQILVDPDETALSLPGRSLATRYEIRAASLIVQHTLPFSDVELRALRAPNMLHDLEFQTTGTEYGIVGVAVRQPDLVDRWHDWVWMDQQRKVQRDPSVLGSSAVLAEACGRLAVNLGQVLGW